VVILISEIGTDLAPLLGWRKITLHGVSVACRLLASARVQFSSAQFNLLQLQFSSVPHSSGQLQFGSASVQFRTQDSRTIGITDEWFRVTKDGIFRASRERKRSIKPKVDYSKSVYLISTLLLQRLVELFG
jgi:hypothetical protein